ncbi:MAG: response regulator [Nitrospinae bacterium]|nr:response regulator [Nitrospinota bacterium]
MKKSEKGLKEGVTVLVMEDDADDYSLLEGAVKSSCDKALIHWVKDGDEAIDFLFRKGEYQDETLYTEPGLIFLDIRVPRKNGLEIAKIIKEDPRLKKVPTIMLTTSSSSSDVLHAYENGANSYLKKPEGSEEMEQFKKAISLFWSSIMLYPQKI